VNNHALLTALADRRAFIVYRLVPGEDQKTDKVPFDPRTGRNVDAQDPANWLLPDEAVDYAETWKLTPEPGVLDYGVGYVVQPGTFFLDLDSCRDPSGGWMPHAVAFLERFPRALREVSVSSTGLHVFGSYTGERPLHRVRNKDYRCELYTGGRFAALGHDESGDLFDDCTFELSQFIAQFFPPREESEHGDEWRTTPVAAWRGPESDDELIDRAMRSQGIRAAVLGRAGFKDLWQGNVEALAVSFPPEKAGSAYNASSADLALFNHLSFWTGSDCARMLRIVQREDCKLRRDKWSRVDNYLVPTILRAVADQTEWYKGQGSAPAPVVIEVPAGTTLTAATVPSIPMPPSRSLQLLPATQAPHVLTLGNKNRFEATLPNLDAVLAKGDLIALGFDTFFGQIMIAEPGSGQWRVLKDCDMTEMRSALERGRGFAPITPSMMRDVLDMLARRNSYDSAQIWLKGLKWDGVQRIDRFLHTHCGAADDEYTRAVSRYIWTGLPARVFEPGCQLDMVVAFQSTQGTRKSSGLQSLAPAPEYFTDNVSLAKDDPDFKRMIRGKLVVEIAELAGLGKAEVEFIKRMITRKVEEWVEKWDKLTTTYKRRCMLFASTNNEQFLPQDDTGQRRWLPVEILMLNDVLITQDREQLWAEGAARWAARKNAGDHGVDWRDAENLARGRHAKHEQSDVWEAKIEKWLNTPIEAQGQTLLPAPCTRPFETSEVLEGAIRMTAERMDKRAANRAGSVLRQLGYDSATVRLPGVAKPVKRWVRKAEA
jgi:Virulence-associated protein E